jgi:hypothetical protein
LRLLRGEYERIGERKFDVEAYIPVGRGYIILDHPAVDMLRRNLEVPLGVEGEVPLGGHELNVPGLGRLIGTVRSVNDDVPKEEHGVEDDLVFMAILAQDMDPSLE